MHLVAIKLKNFRCYREETTISLEKFVTIVGRNDAGKSAILEALAIFFGEAELEQSDLSIGATPATVEITCIFDNLPSEIVLDTNHPTTFAAEYLVHDGKLEVIKRYSAGTKTSQLGMWIRCSHPTAASYSDLLKLKKDELKSRADELGVNLEGVDTRKNPPVRKAIWEACNNLQLADVELLVEKAKDNEEIGDAAKIGKKIQELLPTFALFKSDRASSDQDAEAQDPLNSAVKEALAQQQAALDAIFDQVRHQVQSIANRTVEKIREMSPDLARGLHPIVTPKPIDKQFKVSLTGDDEIPINKRGSGVRRLILLNFFRAKAEDRAHDHPGNGIIYAVEEPETSQHPVNQKMLLRAFEEIASSQRAQIILTTHTPMLAGLVNRESLRYIPHIDRPTNIGRASIFDWQEITRDLGILPDSSVRLFVGIEGVNDINFLKGISKLLRQRHTDILDIDACEGAGELVFFPTGGSNLKHWLEEQRLPLLNRQFYHIVDRDAGEKTVQNQARVNRLNGTPNCEAVMTEKREMENYIHSRAVDLFVNAEMRMTTNFNSFTDDEDVPLLVASTLRDMRTPETPWGALSAEDKKDKEAGCKGWLNKGALAFMTLEMLDETDPNGEILGWLRRLAAIHSSFGAAPRVVIAE